jgi:hypothetical protein
VTERRFTESEVSLILRRTAQLSQNAIEAGKGDENGNAHDPHGLLREEVESIAREAGLDPTHARQAMREVAENRLVATSAPGQIATTASPEARPGLFGSARARTTHAIERAIDDEEMSRIIGEFEAQRGEIGTVEKRGDGLVWSSKDVRRPLHLALRRGRQSTEIALESDFRQVRGGVFGGILGGLGGGMSPLLAAAVVKLGFPMLIAPAILAYLLLLFGTIRWGYLAFLRRQSAELAHALDRSLARALAAGDRDTQAND